MGIVVIGATFVDIKGFPCDAYLPTGRNVGYVEYIHGGVARNLVEDIANVELRPTFISIVDDTPLGTDVLQKLVNHKVNVEYVQRIPDGMGTWLAVFDNNGDVAGSISKRPNMLPVLQLLEEKGDEIFAAADAAVVEVDIDKDIVKLVLDLCESLPSGGICCVATAASFAISWRPGNCLWTTTAIRPPRKCATFWQTSCPRQRSPAWWSPWAPRARCMPIWRATKAFAPPAMCRSKTPPAQAMPSVQVWPSV